MTFGRTFADPDSLTMGSSPGVIESNKLNAMRDYKRKRATYLHLLDLKRAGHSPTKTESIIGHDRAVPLRYRAPVDFYSQGISPAALCAAEGTVGKWR